jgi:hypothetical protein
LYVALLHAMHDRDDKLNAHRRPATPAASNLLLVRSCLHHTETETHTKFGSNVRQVVSQNLAGRTEEVRIFIVLKHAR